MPYCVVVNCQSDSKNKTQEKDYQWFKLPDESTLQSKCFRKRWLEVINRNFKPSEHTRICSKHFLDTDYLPDDENLSAKKEPKKKKKLKPTAIPSLFLKNAKIIKARLTKNSNCEDSAQATTSFAKDDNNENESPSPACTITI